MKGYIYICKIKNKPIYKIGRALNVTKREGELKVGNPFLSVIAIKLTDDYIKTEKEIHNSLSIYHFQGEWYKLTESQYNAIFNEYEFKKFISKKNTKKSIKYHIFKKSKIVSGEKVYRWYYWFYDGNQRQIQKACRGCKNRGEAELYMRQPTKRREKKHGYRIFRKPKIVSGEKVYRWYYWFYDESGKQVQKACRGCKNREEAENYILKLAKSV